MSKEMTGAEMVIEALADQGVKHIFGYPGGAVLPIYDAIFQQERVKHVLVRHEQGAVHMAEGYARSTGKVGCVLVTSGPGATNAVTGLTDALDGFDPDRLHHRPGADPPDRQRRVPGMRHGRHHAALHQAQLSGEADRGSAARAARGVLCRGGRPSGSGGGRYPEGHPVRQGHLFGPAEHQAQDLYPEGEGRPRQDQAGGRSDGQGEASAILYRRRRDQFRQGSEPPAARAGEADRLSDHLDADGARRVPGGRSAMARHARHARHLRSQHGDARLRRDDLHRRALRRPHHRQARRVRAVLQEDPCRHRCVLDQQERQGRCADRGRLRACAGRHDADVARVLRCSRTRRRWPIGGS